MSDDNKLPETLRRVCVGLAMCLMLAFTILLCSMSSVRAVYVFDGEEAKNEKPIRTSESDWRAVLKENGYTVADADEVDAVVVGNRADIRITRSFSVTVRTYLRDKTMFIVPMTVEELLESARVILGQYDTVSPSLDTMLTNEVDVVVKRVSFSEREAVEEIKGESVTRSSPLVSSGNTAVVETETSDGVAVRTYLDKYVDGKLESSIIIKEDFDPHPMNAVTLVGDPDAVVSTLGDAFKTELDENGAPLEYERVINDAVCTAYSFEPGVYGSSGLHLYPGFVAVDPEKIPLGSLLYIADPDGFTYGFAVAADYCEAAVEGIVDVDLFFETYEESLLFGKRRLDVYVIKQLYADELERYVANVGMFDLRVPVKQGEE